jgi:ribosomal protein S14
MKKLIAKDKKLRLKLKNQDKQYFVLKTICQNSNLFVLTRWNAYLRLKILGKANSMVSTSARCVYTINRERFNSLTPFSRHVFLKLIRSGQLSGIRKSSW